MNKSSMTFGALRTFKASISNLLARVSPSTYVKLTKQTGRGDRNSETSTDIAHYFQQCFDEYFAQLGIPQDQYKAFLTGKTVLEYGPGDLPGVGMLLVAMGAERVHCVDRFALVNIDSKSLDVIKCLSDMLSGDQLKRFNECFLDPEMPQKGLNSDRIHYVINKNGLSGMMNEADLVISRAVLEHVNDLEATFADMACAMPPGALALHLVDLKSHGLHRGNPLDFLEYPQWLWNLMYSHKGVPNRWRVNGYKDIVARLPIDCCEFHPTDCYSTEQVDAIYRTLAKPFRGLDHDELAWKGFWLKFRKVR